MQRSDPDALPQGQIWVIQPRRLAARSVANWLAKQSGESVGLTYGYHVRFDRKETESTRVLSMTTGMFLRRMQSDPLLENVACVIFDEFHERTLDLDVAFALTTRLRNSLRPELRLVVMSATLAPEPILDYFRGQTSDTEPQNAKTTTLPIGLECEGRSYPVETIYLPGNARDRLENRVSVAIQMAWTQSEGHVLVFMPGVGEIERTARAISSTQLDNEAQVMRLHGGLSPKAQDEVLYEKGGRRKIIIATNIAETSVTVPGVTAVVDSGLAKVSVMDSRLGLSRLEATPISIASADQRAGRAGRTAPGVCVRVWAQAAHATRTPYDAPEIARADLSGVVLMLAEMGETELSQMGWLTPPPEHAVIAATQLLTQLGALDTSGRITPPGRVMAGLPMHARTSRFVIEAARQFPAKDVAIAAALLSERDPFGSPGYREPRLSLFEKIERVKSDESNNGALKTIRSVANQIERAVLDCRRIAPRSDSRNKSPSIPAIGGDLATIDTQSWAKSLLAAFPDRVILRREEDPDRGCMVGGRGVIGLSAFDETASPSPLMLGIEVDGSGKESRVRDAILINESWLAEDAISETIEVEFDETSESVRGRSVRRYHDLALRVTPASVKAIEDTATCLLIAATPHLEPTGFIEKITPSGRAGDATVASMLERISRVNDHNPPAESLSLPELLLEVLRDLCHSRISFAELRKAPWKDHLIGQIGYDRWQVIEREAPTHIQLPSGNRTAVHYAPGKPPWIKAKIQECFGWPTTPRILMGRVPLQLHLLGPNRRPQQITDDLQSFWATTYGEIRKELRRRYPKHYWPEDPITAKATHNGLKPR